MRYVSLVLLTLLFNTPVLAQPGSSAGELSPDVAARVDAVFAPYHKDSSPGCAVAVYDGDRVAYRKAYGIANLDHDVRLTPTSVFHVASLSKQFTGTAILLLAADGKLSLDDDIRTHLPELPDFGRKITIRHLAHHTSGIRDQWDLLMLAGWRYSRDLITDDDVLELLVRQKDLNFAPGERHMYSNSGYTLMALIVSRVSGKSFREFTTERIFKPLGMTNTHFRDNFAEIVKNQAYGYVPSAQSFRLSVTNFDTAGATSLLTTVEDLRAWHANFDTKTVGGEDLQTKLLQRGVLNDGTSIEYAFGITHGRHRGLATVGHGGSDAGYRADFVRFPDRRLGVATLCNSGAVNPAQLSRRVADVFLPANLPAAPAAPAADTTPEVPVPHATLERYAGTYWNQADLRMHAVVLDGGRLHALNFLGLERVAMKSLGNGVFVTTSGVPVRVTFEDAPGRPTQLKLPGAAVLDKVVVFKPSADELAAFAGVYRSDEMDVVFRISVKDGALRLERSKLRPSNLEPVVKDTFRSVPGVIQFTRNGSGGISGFLLQGSRVKNVKFWKELSPARSSSEQ
jgi:CubicO group peptidase (beta-lactamase class C family)